MCSSDGNVFTLGTHAQLIFSMLFANYRNLSGASALSGAGPFNLRIVGFCSSGATDESAGDGGSFC